MQCVANIKKLLLQQARPFQEVCDPHHSLNEKNMADTYRNVEQEKKKRLFKYFILLFK